jgi:hypothetical protein
LIGCNTYLGGGFSQWHTSCNFNACCCCSGSHFGHGFARWVLDKGCASTVVPSSTSPGKWCLWLQVVLAAPCSSRVTRCVLLVCVGLSVQVVGARDGRIDRCVMYSRGSEVLSVDSIRDSTCASVAISSINAMLVGVYIERRRLCGRTMVAYRFRPGRRAAALLVAVDSSTHTGSNTTDSCWVGGSWAAWESCADEWRRNLREYGVAACLVSGSSTGSRAGGAMSDGD